MKLFLLANLLTSTLIYNVLGTIDEKAIEALSFVSNFSRYFQSS